MTVYVQGKAQTQERPETTLSLYLRLTHGTERAYNNQNKNKNKTIKTTKKQQTVQKQKTHFQSNLNYHVKCPVFNNQKNTRHTKKKECMRRSKVKN